MSTELQTQTAEQQDSLQLPVTEEQIEKGAQLEQSTVFFEFHAYRPGFVKTLPSGAFTEKMKVMQTDGEADTEEESHLDSKMLRVSQDIIDRKEIRKIAHHDGKFVGWIKTIAIPCPVRFRGAYLLAATENRITEVEARVEIYLAERINLIKSFELAYPALKEAAKEKRGPFYNEADYPEWAEIEEAYKVEFNWISFNVPQALATINSVVYQKAQQKAKLQWADAVQKAIDAQRATLLNLMDNFTEMLSPSDDTGGKKKKFKSTAVKKLKEFTKMFDELNITNDTELAKIVHTLDGVMEGIEPDALKKDTDLREIMLAKVSEVKTQAAELVTVKERKVFFEEEESAENAEQETSLSLAEEKSTNKPTVESVWAEGEYLSTHGGGTQEEKEAWYKKAHEALGLVPIE